MGGIINFDTLAYAKALAEENKRVFNEFAETQLATKKDLFLVKEEMPWCLITSRWMMGKLKNKCD